MASTRSQKGQSTNNAAGPPISLSVKLATEAIDDMKQPPGKRVRVTSSDVAAGEPPTAGNAAGSPGLRERLLSLPVELFGEICSFLDPLELRCLSLTDETFWSILVSTKSDPIWREAFKRTVPPMPDRPETMSGPSYARFMLAESCMICQLKPPYVRLYYFHRVQYCDACRPSSIISEKAVLELYPDYRPEFLNCLSSGAVSSDGATLASFYYEAREDHPLYLKVTIAEVYKLWKSLSKTADNPEQANTQLTARLKKYADDRIRSGLKMEDWHLAASEVKAEQLKKLREERAAMILAKLSELGYDEVDFPRRHYEVYKSEVLTDEEWERIRLVVAEAAESIKNNRISFNLYHPSLDQLTAVSNSGGSSVKFRSHGPPFLEPLHILEASVEQECQLFPLAMLVTTPTLSPFISYSPRFTP